MNEQANLRNVIENGFCIACGACVAAEEGIALRLNSRKMLYEPDSHGGKTAASVCPAVCTDYQWLQEEVFPGAVTSPVGVVTSMVLAQSTDYQRNMSSSSGGIVKDLLIEYLSRDEVDGVIALSHEKDLLFRPTLITEPEQVDHLPGSIYHNVPFDNALTILKENQGRFVLVANPCQLEGIYTYIFKHARHLLPRIYATVGLVCGWAYNHHALKAICQYKGIDFNELRDVAYRGGGPVGNLRLRTHEKDIDISRRRDIDYIAAFDRSFNLRRCHVCVNHINFLADVVVGDAWLRRVSKTQTGTGIVICRTPETREIIDTLERKGKIRTAPADESDIVESQGRALTYGDFAYALADYLKHEGEYCPELIGPNRPAAQQVSNRNVKCFHRTTSRKRKLQRSGAYRALWLRKILVDLARYAIRFFVKKVRSRKGDASHGSRSKSDASGLRDFL